MAYLSKENQVRSKTPHKKYKKPKKKKVKTPVPSGPKECAGCGKSKYLEVHHVFPGANRDNSSRYGCVEWLCYHHHRGQPDGVHGGNSELDLKLKRKHQLLLMKSGMSLDDFIKIFSKSYMVRGD